MDNPSTCLTNQMPTKLFSSFKKLSLSIALEINYFARYTLGLRSSEQTTTSPIISLTLNQYSHSNSNVLIHPHTKCMNISKDDHLQYEINYYHSNSNLSLRQPCGNAYEHAILLLAYFITNITFPCSNFSLNFSIPKPP